MMVIRLQEGERKAEVEANDMLIKQDLCYAGVFERTVTKVANAFYATVPAKQAKP